MTQLVPMAADDFKAFVDWSIIDYANEKVLAGNWTAAEALDRSRVEFAKLLPEGLATPRQHLYTISDESTGDKVGVIWFEEAGFAVDTAWLLQLVIWESYRRRGYGEAAMRLLEDQVRQVGLRRIGLHVFGHNAAAQALYRKVGYEVTNINMAKNVAED